MAIKRKVEDTLISLEEDDDGLHLVATYDGDEYNILTISEDGISRYEDLPEELGFILDEDGKIMLDE